MRVMHRTKGTDLVIERVRCDKCLMDLVEAAEDVNTNPFADFESIADNAWPSQTKKERKMKLTCESCGLNDNSTSPQSAGPLDALEKIEYDYKLMGRCWILIGVALLFNIVAHLKISPVLTVLSNGISMVLLVGVIGTFILLWRNRK